MLTCSLISQVSSGSSAEFTSLIAPSPMGTSVADEPNTNESDIHSLPSSRRHTEHSPSVHKVGIPPRKKLVREFTEILKETFFADDPLRSFKGQPKSRKIALGIQSMFPVLQWGRDYNLTKFKGDLIAGLTIASLCIPQVHNTLIMHQNIRFQYF